MKWIFPFLGISLHALALQNAPWTSDAYEFVLWSEEVYSQYRYISHAIEQPSHTYRNYLTRESLSFAIGDSMEVEYEVELAKTPHQKIYGLRSMALAGKYLFLDDIAGDLMTLSMIGNIRGVGGRATKDVSSPYGSYGNLEGGLSVGKEFIKTDTWITRGYLMGMLGIANHGSFWNRIELSFEGKLGGVFVGKGFCKGYFGYGLHEKVNINHFHGWGKIAHRCLDIGIECRYLLTLWGEFGISYAYRALAISYPKGEQTIALFYQLPFSLF